MRAHAAKKKRQIIGTWLHEIEERYEARICTST